VTPRDGRWRQTGDRSRRCDGRSRRSVGRSRRLPFKRTRLAPSWIHAEDSATMEDLLRDVGEARQVRTMQVGHVPADRNAGRRTEVRGPHRAVQVEHLEQIGAVTSTSTTSRCRWISGARSRIVLLHRGAVTVTSTRCGSCCSRWGKAGHYSPVLPEPTELSIWATPAALGTLIRRVRPSGRAAIPDLSERYLRLLRGEHQVPAQAHQDQ
jgi:hypothetical protein